jgi:hypothetical protein
VLPLSGPIFARQRGGPLPTIAIVRNPRDANANVFGQFIYVGAPRPGNTGQDSLRYRLEYQNLTIEEDVDLHYTNVCASSYLDEFLFYLPAGRYFVPAASTTLAGIVRAKIASLFTEGAPGFQRDFGESLEGVRLDKPICIQTTEQSLTGPIDQQLRQALSPAEYIKWKDLMANDRLVGTNALRWISFQTAQRVANSKKRPGGPVYRVPQAVQWLVGLVVAIELGDLSTGGNRPPVPFKRSYLEGVHEWVDTQDGLDTNTRYLLGPSEIEKDKWLAYEKLNLWPGAFGVRLIRDP